MVVRAQIGNCPHMGILVFGLGLVHGLLVSLGDVVDARLVLLSIGVDHGSVVTAPRVALPLHVPFLFAVAAHYIGVARPVAAGRAGI